LISSSPLLAITGEIVESRTLAIFFSGPSKLLNTIVSTLRAQAAFNLKQKAEKTLILFGVPHNFLERQTTSLEERIFP